jgi:hypothetical protein
LYYTLKNEGLAGKIVKYFFRFIIGFLVTVILLFVMAAVLIQQPRIQTALVQYAAGVVADRTGAEVSIEAVEIGFFNKVRLANVYVSDLQGDTLAYIRHLDTRLSFINPFKSRFYFNTVAIDGLRANVHRADGDSTFNFQFLIDAFVNPSRVPSPLKEKPSDKYTDIRVNKITLTDIQLVYDDPEGGQGHFISLSKLQLKVNEIDLKLKVIDAPSLVIEQPAYALVQYKPSTEDSLPKEPFSFHLGWVIKVGKLDLKDGFFSLHQVYKPRPTSRKGFDPSWMDVQQINLLAKNFNWNSVMSVDIKRLSAKDDADALDLKRLSAKLSLSDDHIEAKALEISYNENTLLDADARIDFNGLHQFSDFYNKVLITAHIRDLRTNGSDVGVWSKAAARYVPKAAVSGKFYGTVSNLRTEGLRLLAGDRTVLEGNIAIKGLPYPEKMFMDASITKLNTHSAELSKIVPWIKLPPQVKDLGAVAVNGSFKGSLENFSTKVSLKSDLGNLAANLQMKIPSRRPPSYLGSVQSDGLNLGKILGTELLGNVDFDLNVNGSGFNLKDLNTQVEGYLKDVDLNYYRYERIDLSGFFSQKMFEGHIHMEDECALIDFNGSVDLNDPELPKYNFYGKIVDADFQQLNILPNSKLIVNIEGDFEFEGKDINNLIGQADLSNIRLQDDQFDVILSDFQICLEKIDDYKEYTIKSEDVDVELKGYFDPLKLPVSMQFFFSKHTTLLSTPGFESLDDLMATQDLEMNITIRKDFGLVSLIDPKISKFSDVNIKGNYNNELNKVNLDIKIDSLVYDNIGFNVFSANLFDRNDSIIITSRLGSLDLGNNRINNIRLGATSNLTGLYSRLRVEDDSAKNNLELITAARFLGDTIDVSFPRSRIKVNHKDWEISKGNRIVIIDSTFQLQNFALQQGPQRISISNRNNLSDATVRIEQLDLAELMQIVDTTGILSKGLLDANINVRNPLKAPEVDGDLELTGLTVYGMEIDRISLDAKLSDREKALIIKGGIDDDLNKVQINGRYSLKPDDKNPIDIAVEFDRLDLGWLAFPIILGNEISNLRAAARGNIKVGGNLKQIGLEGNASIIDTASVKVNLLGASISFIEEDIVLKPKSIELFKGGSKDKNIRIFDNFGNSALLSAKLEHEYFKDFGVVAKISTDRFNFMNTTYADNNLFFGRVFASGTVDMNGPVNNLNMDINARTLPGTEFNIVAGGTDGDKMADFVNFVDRSRPADSTSATRVNAPSGGVNMNMNIMATQDAQVKLYLDYAANDVIRARGNGELNMRMSADGSAPTMVGEYVAVGGDYLFSQQDIVNKRFNIRNGSTVSWSGDMMDARMNVDAVFTARANMNSIVDSNSTLSNRRLPVDVVLNIGGTLAETEIGFKMEPARGSVAPDELVAVLDRINQDPYQANTQAFGLILFNSFINLQGAAPGSSNVGSELIMTTLTEFFNNKVSEYFNDALEMLLPGTEVAISQGIDNTGIRVTRKLSNDRLIINLGGDVQYGNAQRLQLQQNNTGFIGDVEIEYLITEDGRIRFRAYSRYDNTIIRLENESYLRTGVGITYQKEFNRLNQLFIRDNKGQRKKKKQEQGLPPAPGFPTTEEKDVPFSEIITD